MENAYFLKQKRLVDKVGRTTRTVIFLLDTQRNFVKSDEVAKWRTRSLEVNTLFVTADTFLCFESY